FNPGATNTGIDPVGMAYDPIRDLFYVSYQVQLQNNGLVISFPPSATPDISATLLFRTDTFTMGGLAYDPATQTLWTGDATVVRGLSLTGQVLSSFTRPQPGGFVSGLEFIPPSDQGGGTKTFS